MIELLLRLLSEKRIAAMANYMDYRLGKTYDSSRQFEFRFDTLRTKLKFPQPDEDDARYQLRGALKSLFCLPELTHSDVAAARIAEASLNSKGFVSWKQAFAICTLLGCIIEEPSDIRSAEALLEVVDEKFEQDFKWWKATEANIKQGGPGILYLAAAGKAEDLDLMLAADLLTQVTEAPTAKAQSTRRSSSSALVTRMFGRRNTSANHGGSVSLEQEQEEDESQDGNQSVWDSHLLLQRDMLDNTPLLLAVLFGHEDCVEVIVQAAKRVSDDLLEAVLQATDAQGVTPVAEALNHYKSGPKCASTLVQYGADIWNNCIKQLISRASRSPSEYFPIFKDILAVASHSPGFDINKISIRNDADLNVFARMYGFDPTVEGFADEDDYDEEEDGNEQGSVLESGEEASQAAAGDINDESVSTPQERCKGNQLLRWAIEKQSIECVQELIDAGADVGSKELMCAVKSFDPLHAFGVQAYARDADFGPIDLTAALTILKIVLEAPGVDVNAKGGEGTALHVAAEMNNLSVVKLLMSKGADDTIRDEFDMTAYDVATENNCTEAADYLNSASVLQRLMSDNTIGGSQLRAASSFQESIPEEKLCVICQAKPKQVALAPCGHRMTCKKCTRNLLERPKKEHKCPYCRCKIESFIVQVFDV